MDWLTCRVCLESGDLVSLFDCDENKKQLGDKFSYLCGIMVTSLDPLPTMICVTCVEKLTFAYQFKKQCLTSNKILKECIMEVKNKLSVAPAAMEPDAQNSTAKETETITIQKKGTRRQYRVPIEDNPSGHHSKTHLAKTQVVKVCTKVPRPNMRGLPSKNLNEQGPKASPNSLCTRKEEMEQSQTQMLKNNDIGYSFNDNDQPEADPLDDTSPDIRMKKRAIKTAEQSQRQPIDDGIGVDNDPKENPLDGYCKKKKPATKGTICQICKFKYARTNDTKRFFLARFPKNEERCKKWVQITGNLDLVYVPIEKLHQLKYLCGKHFQDKDFNKKKTNLRKKAIPSKELSAEPLSDEIMKDFPLHIYKEKTFTHDHIYASAKFDVDEM